MSFGPRLMRLRQRAASSSSALESGPPETARTSAGADWRPANSVSASLEVIGSVRSAAGTLLGRRHALLHAARGLGIFAADLAERGAGRLALAERGERLAEPQQRVGRLGARLELGGDREEGFRRVAVALPVEQALAQPVIGVRRLRRGRVLAQEAAQGLLRQGVVAALDIAVAEIV